MIFKPDTRCSCTVEVAVNHSARAGGKSIDMLVLHYTGMVNSKAAIDWLICEESGVSCHYFVFEDGRIVQLVPEYKRAWHAGKACWQGETDINSRSIGIEIANPGHEHGYSDFTGSQIEAVIGLCGDIVVRHDIAPRHVLAHSDVAPSRKQDPGEKFPWKKLHQNGIGHWVEPVTNCDGEALQPGGNGESVAALQAMLALYGYPVELSGVYDIATVDCVRAFQRHFRPSKVDGNGDAATVATLKKLIGLLEQADSNFQL